MPRTKLPKATNSDVASLMKQTEEILQIRRKNVKTMITTLRQELDADLELSFSKFDPSLLKMTLGEARRSLSTGISTETVSQKSQNSKRKRRSRSCNSVDDGYLTADSGSGNPATLKKLTIKKFRSKSLTKEKANNESGKDFVTPMNMKVIANSGITPKVELTAPIMVIRDAKPGEVAFSTMGSPLTASRNVVNLQIPLGNGDNLNLQPHKGLRQSRIPELRRSTAQQLNSLLENLNKICEHFQLE